MTVTPHAPTSTPLEDRPAKNAYWVLGLLTLTYMFSFLDRQILAILAEPIKADLNLSDTQVGLLTGFMFALFYTTFGVPIAWLADRTSRIRIIAISCTLWSVFTCACAAAMSFWQLALARIGVGVGEAGGTPPAYSIISDLFPPARRAWALGLYSLGMPAGFILGTAVAGLIANAYGWRMAFVAVGAPGVLLGLLIFLTLRDPPRARLSGQPDTAAPSFWAAIRWFFANPLLVRLAIASGLAGFSGYGFLNWTPALLLRLKGMSLIDLGAYYGWVMGLAGGLGVWLGGYIVTRLGRRYPKAYALLPAVALVLAVPFFLGAVLTPHWAPAMLLMGVPAIMTAIYLAPSLALLQNATPGPMRATASAILLMILNLIGLGGGPLFVGALSDILTPHLGDTALVWAMVSLAPFFLLAAAMYVLVGRSIGSDHELA